MDAASSTRPFGDLNGLGKHAACLSFVPLRVKQIHVEREHHDRLEFVSDDFGHLAIRCDCVVAVTRIFERRETELVRIRAWLDAISQGQSSSMVELKR